MAWPAEAHFRTLIAQARQWLTDVYIIEYDVTSPIRAILKLEGTWHRYRLIVSEIHRPDNTVRYAYYVLDQNNRHVHRFDNSSDKRAIRLRYGADWKGHQYEEVPHQHDATGNVTLSPTPMTFEIFIEWLADNLADPI